MPADHRLQALPPAEIEALPRRQSELLSPRRADTVFSVLSDAFVELPLSCLLSPVGVRLLRFVSLRARSLSQPDGPTSLCRSAVFGIRVWEIPRREHPAASLR